MQLWGLAALQSNVGKTLFQTLYASHSADSKTSACTRVAALQKCIDPAGGFSIGLSVAMYAPHAKCQS